MIDNFIKDTFDPHLTTKFQVHLDASRTVELELIKVCDGKVKKPENFSLVFRGPRDIILNQQIHRFEHEQMGAFEMFIVPTGRDQEGTYYEAVFNRG